ncbi:winged helix repair factor 1-like [Pelodiscus sinensis]|uniref:winged helix repair factor 1-like n=1 Tax=Pelodiscus sinensis TaxID=13735 RepID=UPI003F6D8550
MERRRQLISHTLKAKKRRLQPGPDPGDAAEPETWEGPGAVDSALRYLASLFPRQLFEDALPPLVLKHQLYSLVKDRTAVDRHLSRLKDEGLVRLFQLGFDTEAFGVVFAQDYVAQGQVLPHPQPWEGGPREGLVWVTGPPVSAQVLQSVEGKEQAGTVRRFLQTAFTSCADVSYEKGRMLRDFGFQDHDITWVAEGAGGRGTQPPRAPGPAAFPLSPQRPLGVLCGCSPPQRGRISVLGEGFPYNLPHVGLGRSPCVPSSSAPPQRGRIRMPGLWSKGWLVSAGVLTVRDAGSWWLAVPGAGRFVKCFIKGRKAVQAMIQKAKYKEVLLSDLQSRRAPRAVKLGLPYHIHDLIGAQLVDWYVPPRLPAPPSCQL